VGRTYRFDGFPALSASSPQQERLDATARQREDEKWEAFCKPTFKADEFGVRRASCAKKGCEFGLSE
jgi:hypothetical protein